MDADLIDVLRKAQKFGKPADRWQLNAGQATLWYLVERGYLRAGMAEDFRAGNRAWVYSITPAGRKALEDA